MSGKITKLNIVSTLCGDGAFDGQNAFRTRSSAVKMFIIVQTLTDTMTLCMDRPGNTIVKNRVYI